jgi:hypothetical protein
VHDAGGGCRLVGLRVSLVVGSGPGRIGGGVLDGGVRDRRQHRTQPERQPGQQRRRVQLGPHPVAHRRRAVALVEPGGQREHLRPGVACQLGSGPGTAGGAGDVEISSAHRDQPVHEQGGRGVEAQP